MTDHDNLINMIRDRFDKVDEDNAAIVKALEKHAGEDSVYWRKLDRQDGQLTLIKYLFGGGSLSALIAWLYNKFH